jgi:hypothetical protein
MGGPIEGIRQSSAVLRAQGHEVEIVSLDSPDEPWLLDFPIQLHALGPGIGSYGYAAGKRLTSFSHMACSIRGFVAPIRSSI